MRSPCARMNKSTRQIVVITGSSEAIMRRNIWLKVLVAAVALYALGLLAFAFIPPTPGVTRHNYYRVHIGMTQNEVEAIFGGPADSDEKINRNAIGFFFVG